jgi:hypothetical protein
LGADVNEECFGGPSSEDHDACRGDVLEEECHGGTGSDGLVSDFAGVEAEGGFASEVLACCAKELAHEAVGDGQSFVFDTDCADFCVGGSVRNKSVDSLDGGNVSQYWAEEWMAGAPLSAAVHFLARFLVDECDGDILGEEGEDWIRGVDDLFGGSAENDAGEDDYFCFARGWSC